MSRASFFADLAAALSLKLLAALNILFVAVFVAVTLAAAGKARAEIPACTGIDMLAELERGDPDAAVEIRAEAAATPNGSGLLWRIERNGGSPSFLFGTMHMADPRLLALSPAVNAAFEAAGTVAIETTDVLDQARMLAAVAAHPELMMFTDGTTLASLLAPDEAEAVEAALDARGIPLATVNRMKPWMIAAMVTLPACEHARKAAGAPILDQKLAEEAQAQGKSLVGLETVTDQLRAMESLPMDFHIRGLVDTLRLGERIDDIVETMVVLYTEGETGMFWPLFRAVLPQEENEESGYVEFERVMITARNRHMAERAVPLVEAGPAFIAVGALHLPGPEGLVELLRAEGYEVTAVE